MKRYPKYKDSGIEWIGEIPKEWEIKRLKFVGIAKNGLTYKPENVCANGTLVLRATNIQNNEIILEDNVYVNCEISEEIILRKKDLLICSANGSRALVGKCAIIDKPVIGETYGSFMMVFRSEYNNFIKYILSSNALNFYKSLFVTTTINQLTKEHLYNITIPFPKVSEQAKIISYLDNKTAIIDTLISDKQKLIELLREKRQAIISEAVTKGLNRNVPMKNSGVEWIGKIPAEWEIRKIKYLITSHQGGAWGEESCKNEFDRICVRVADFNFEQLAVCSENYTIRNYTQEQIKKLQLRKGDILIEKSGGGENSPVGRVVMFNHNFPALYANFIEALKPNGLIYPSYLCYVLAKLYYLGINKKYYNQTTGIQNLNVSEYLDESIMLPTLAEQKNISDYLNKKTSKIDIIITDITTQIKKLKEYRQSIISEAVTGKIMITEETAISEEPISKRKMVFKRLLLSAYILDNICEEPTTGHVKFEKLLYLSEHCAEIPIHGEYHRKAAGPYDPKALYAIDGQLKNNKWFERKKSKDDSRAYTRLEKANDYKKYLASNLNGMQKNIVDKLIRLFKRVRTIQCEIVATLYGAWNDFLIEGVQPSDEQIVNEVLTNWHKNKEKVDRKRWLDALTWMRKENIIPVGYGLSTKGGKR
jgi:type I restriction enzyme S subunit